jgi:hypothetical protein
MANPTIKKLDEKTVEKIATAVTAGTVNKHWLKGRDMAYIVTTRITGQTAPTVKQITDEGRFMFQDNPEQEIIESSAAIDVYVYCNNGDSDLTDHGYLVVTV